MDVDQCLRMIEDKYDFKFKEKQEESIRAIVQLNDTFITLPTGYGKSSIYFYLPEIFEALTGEKSSIVVISPLQALMLDQVQKLEKLSITSVVVGEIQKDKGVGQKISEGQFSIVFSSPEAALTSGMWRKSLTSGVFHDRVKAVVIDEAHCIIDFYEFLVEEQEGRHLLFNSSMIETIVENADFIFSEDDIVSLGLIDHNLAGDILELIAEVKD